MNQEKRKVTVIRFPDENGPEQVQQVLKSLWDKICGENRVDRLMWTKLVDGYILRKKAESGEPIRNMVEERSSVNKKFSSQEKMTVRTFFDALNMLRAKKVRLGVTIVHANGNITDHGIWVDVNANLEPDESLDNISRIPQQIQLLETTLDHVQPTQSSQPRFHVPPPDLSQYTQTFPSAEGSDRSDHHEGSSD